MCNLYFESLMRILSLRDMETKAHTQRVTTMVIDLARAMDIPESDLANIYRGAMLHDIGKIGIPDSILYKSDALTHEEQRLMRMHPVYAYELLQPVSCLQPALDIPYCHHEKWDGTGYPRGLKGEQIPFAARLFAVVDVWDALLSDRPYRLAWAKERAIEYLQEQSGRHFEPDVVNVFLEKLILPAVSSYKEITKEF
jgi:putative two-component system response regulator